MNTQILLHQKQKYLSVLLCIFLLALMMSFFLYYQQQGILQLDLVGIAAYAEYIVLDYHDQALQQEYAPYEHGELPWRAGNNIFTTLFFSLFHLFGADNAEFSVFFTQFFFGSFAVVFLYLFLFELYARHFPAAISALVFGISAPLFNAVLSKDHGAEFFFAFLALYLLLIGLQKKNILLLFLSNVSLGLLLWIREGTLFFPFVYYGFFLLHHNRMIISFRAIIAITIPYILLAIGAFRAYVWLLFVVALQKTNAAFFTHTVEILSSVVAWYPLLYFLFVLVGLYFGILKKEKTVLFFAVLSILFFVLFTKNATYDIRHLGIYIFFPLSVIICYGLCCLSDTICSWKRYCVMILAILLCVQVFVPGIALFEQRKEHIYTKEFAIGIASVVPKDGIVFVQKDFCLFVVYYAKRHCQGIPADTSVFEQLLADGRRVFVFYEAGFGFFDDATKEAVEEQYSLSVSYTGKFETFHHADLAPQVYDEQLIEVKGKIP